MVFMDMLQSLLLISFHNCIFLTFAVTQKQSQKKMFVKVTAEKFSKIPRKIPVA